MPIMPSNPVSAAALSPCHRNQEVDVSKVWFIRGPGSRLGAAPARAARNALDPGRREFLAKTALLGAVSAVGAMPWFGATAQTKGTSTASRTPMKTRKLGQLEVSEMGSGCMSISANYGPPADRS